MLPAIPAATTASTTGPLRPATPARPFADVLAAALDPRAPPIPRAAPRLMPLQDGGRIASGPAAPRGSAPAAADPSVAARPLALLETVERARVRLDGLLAQARAGRTFSAGELLALQAEAYRTVQTVDLATHLVEQGAQAVKQALATPL